MMKNIIKLIKQNFVPVSVIFICIYALYLRLMALYLRELWCDELQQLDLIRNSGTFLELIAKVRMYEPCAYLTGDCYLIYPFFKIFSYNKWGLAIPHIIATILGFYLLYLICRRYFKTVWGYLITFLIACFNATMICHATEIRTYAVLPTLAMATFYLFQKIADSNFKLSFSKRIGATIFFVLVIWFHVFNIVMFFSCFLFTLLFKYKEDDFKIYLKDAIFFTGIVLLFAMPFWLYSILVADLSYRDGFSRVTFEYIANPLHNIVGFLKDIFCNLIGDKKLYFLFLGVIIPFSLSYKDRYKQLLFLTFIIIFPISVLVFSAMLKNYWFLQRQFIWVMPFFAFYLGWVWDSFFILLRRRGR